MSSPIFSSDPADYGGIKELIEVIGLTPVIVVIGGSLATGQDNDNSDLDIWGAYLEDEPSEISIGRSVRRLVLGDAGLTQMILFSMKAVREQIQDPYIINDPPRRIWLYEDFMAYPRIFDSQHAIDFRVELSAYTPSEVAQWYLEAGDRFVEMASRLPKMAERTLRLYLTGCRLIETEELIISYQDLLTWSGISDLTIARERLVSNLGE